MNPVIVRRLLVLPCCLAVAIHVSATTCVATKTFKVEQVCGKVMGPFNEAIARATIELLNGSEVSSQVLTNDQGEFLIPGVSTGQYEIQVRSPGYVTAAQKIIVTRNTSPHRCHKPIQVNMTPGSMGCSTVNK
jgi:hypothetical protein